MRLSGPRQHPPVEGGTVQQTLATQHHVRPGGILHNLQPVLDHGDGAVQPAAAAVLRLRTAAWAAGMGGTAGYDWLFYCSIAFGAPGAPLAATNAAAGAPGAQLAAEEMHGCRYLQCVGSSCRAAGRGRRGGAGERRGALGGKEREGGRGSRGSGNPERCAAVKCRARPGPRQWRSTSVKVQATWGPAS